MDATTFTASDFFSAADFHALKPAILLCLFGCGILLTDAFFVRRTGKGWYNAITALVAEGTVMLAVLQHLGDVRSGGPLSALNGSILIDGFGVFFNIIFVLAGVLAVILSARYMESEGEHRGEYYALVLFAQAGMSIMATGNDLVVLFVALETMALSFYVMVGFLRRSTRSNEAAMKYLILGAFSSGLLAYGLSILYGIAGSTNLEQIAEAVAARPDGDWATILTLITTSVGLFFKIAAVPFHMWAPDVYEGAPTPTTAYVSVASKAASFALMIRLFLSAYGSVADAWIPLLGAIALITMTIGNLAAVTQSNLKRLLAYSSVAHGGYILLGLVAANEPGLRGVAIYILAYVFMNFGAFALIAALRRDGEAAEELDDLNGLAARGTRLHDPSGHFHAVAGGYPSDGRVLRQVLHLPGPATGGLLPSGCVRRSLRRRCRLLLFPRHTGLLACNWQRQASGARHEPRHTGGTDREWRPDRRDRIDAATIPGPRRGIGPGHASIASKDGT